MSPSKFSSKIELIDFVLLSLLAIIMFFPLFFGGFTTHDDVVTAINEWSGRTWEYAKESSKVHGRVLYHYGFELASLPFLFDNRVWYIFVKYGSFFLLMSALAYSLFKIYKSSWISLAALAIFLSILQNGWEHNAITSYPFVFNFYATLFLLSLGVFVTAIERRSLIISWVSGLLYFFSLGTELFVLYFPFYLVIILSSRSLGDRLLHRLKIGKIYILSIAVPLLLYLAIYLLWRFLYPSTYEGNSLAIVSLYSAIKVILTYSLTAFPLASLKLYAAPGDPYLFNNFGGLRAVFHEMNVAHLMKPLVVGILFYRLFNKPYRSMTPANLLIIGIALSCIGIFLPNFLLGFTTRHPAWVGAGTYSYVYTYFSFISAVVFLALLLALANAKSYSWHRAARFLFVSLTIISFVILSFVVEVRNQYFALDQKLAHRKWQLVDVVINSPAFMEIHEGAVVVAPTLMSPTRGYAAVLADDWRRYVKYKTGKDIKFVSARCELGLDCYSLVIRQDPQWDKQFAVLSKTMPKNINGSYELFIFAMPYQPEAVVIATFNNSTLDPKVNVNCVDVFNVGAGVISFKMPLVGDNSVQTAHVVANVEIDAEQMVISNYGVEPVPRAFFDRLVDGIDFTRAEYPDYLIEALGVSGRESGGRWTDAAIHPSVKLGFKHRLPERFALEITASAFASNVGNPVKVKVGSVERTFIVSSDANAETSRLIFEYAGDADFIEIFPPNPVSPNELDPRNNDRRKLGIRLVSLKIKPL